MVTRNGSSAQMCHGRALNTKISFLHLKKGHPLVCLPLSVSSCLLWVDTSPRLGSSKADTTDAKKLRKLEGESEMCLNVVPQMTHALITTPDKPLE